MLKNCTNTYNSTVIWLHSLPGYVDVILAIIGTIIYVVFFGETVYADERGPGGGRRDYDEEMLELYLATRPLTIMGEWNPENNVPPPSRPASPSAPCSYEPNTDTDETAGEVEVGVEVSKEVINKEQSELLELQEGLKEDGIIKENGSLGKELSTLTRAETRDLDAYYEKKEEVNYSKEYLKNNPCGTHRPSYPGPDDHSPDSMNLVDDEGLYEKFKSNAACRKNVGKDD
jgi:hypothetical protein